MSVAVYAVTTIAGVHIGLHGPDTSPASTPGVSVASAADDGRARVLEAFAFGHGQHR